MKETQTHAGLQLDSEELSVNLESYEAGSLSRAKAHWFLGEWDKLAALDLDSFRHHPDRDRFALLVASAHQQLGAHDETRKYVRLALEWGCRQSLVARILVAGVHNTLGKIAALKNDEKRTALHFRESIRIAADNDETDLVSHTRSLREMTRLGLLPQTIGAQPIQYFVPNTTSVSNAVHKSRNLVHKYWRSGQQEPMSYVNVSEKRSLRLVEIFQQYVTPGWILEIGTNAGRNLHHLYATGYTNLVGIEISPAAVATLRNVYPELSEVTIHVGTVEDIIESFPDKSFECVFTMAVLEHIHFDSDWIFAHIARIARCVITIEDELRSGERHFPRNYERIFTNLGMRQVHMEDRSKWGLPTGFAARVFI